MDLFLLAISCTCKATSQLVTCAENIFTIQIDTNNMPINLASILVNRDHYICMINIKKDQIWLNALTHIIVCDADGLQE